ncbi:MAG: nucleotide sugar dehydrogenase [Chloroflexota bacterium]
MTYKAELLERLNSRHATIGVVGLGYVGLPLAVEFAEADYNVIGFDLSESKISRLNSGDSYIPDIPSARLAPPVNRQKLCGTTDASDLAHADAIIICVPTPLRKTRDPDMSFIIAAVNTIKAIARKGTLVVLESTTYPGTTAELVVPQLEEMGFTIGDDIFVAFSPERIDPGNTVYQVRNTPKVVGGMTPHCTEVTQALYRAAVDNVVPVSSPTSAEMVKLLENTFRAVNIGLVNEMALMCDRLGIDVWEVIDAAATKPFGFMPFYPGPGLGGHCIPVDPHYLSWKLKTLNYNARFIELASEVNTSMPYHVMDKITDALNDDSKSVRGARVVVLGVAYKRDVDDVRESPALDVIGLLREKGADVVYHDPHVASLRLDNRDGERIHSVDYSEALLAEADCVVIITNHTAFDYAHITRHSQLIIDTRHAITHESDHARVVLI